MNPTFPSGYLRTGSLRAAETKPQTCQFCGKEHVAKLGSLGCDDCKQKHAEELKARRKVQEQKAMKRFKAAKWLESRCAELRSGR